MNDKTETLKRLRKAKIYENDWFLDIRENIQSQFAKGYITHAAETLSDTFAQCDEEFRQGIIQAANCDIWK